MVDVARNNAGQPSDTELLRWIVRSAARLESYIPIDESQKAEATQRMAFVRWHHNIISEAQTRGLLPKVPMTKQTDAGKASGAI